MQIFYIQWTNTDMWQTKHMVAVEMIKHMLDLHSHTIWLIPVLSCAKIVQNDQKYI